MKKAGGPRRRVPWFAAAVLFTCAQPLSGQMRFAHHFIERWKAPDPGGWGQTALADIDRDGDMDFIMGRRGGVVLWYEYRVAGEWPQRRWWTVPRGLP